MPTLVRFSTAVFGLAFILTVAVAVASGPGREAFGVRPPEERAQPSLQPPSSAGIAPRAHQEAALTPPIEHVPIDASPQRGPANAPVTIVEFGDFECPFSARAFATLQEIEKAYSGTVRFVFKHHPQPEHPMAPLASEYALAAGEQGRFWEMHDRIFAAPEGLDRRALEDHARAIGLDLARLHAFLDRGDARKQVASDHALAVRLEVASTPVFFINGVRLGGAPPLPAFAALIDRALAVPEAVIGAGVEKDQVYDELMKRAQEMQAEAAHSPPPFARPEGLLLASKMPGVPATGAIDRRVSIIEVADFDCPYSAELAPILSRILAAHRDTVELRFRNLPADSHRHALAAARAAMAAHRQGKFWAMHDKLFEQRAALGEQDLERDASALGLDLAQWERDRVSAGVELDILRDREDALEAGVHETPTVFVNGRVIRGVQPYATYESAIAEALAKAIADDLSAAKARETRSSTASGGSGSHPNRGPIRAIEGQ